MTRTPKPRDDIKLTTTALTDDDPWQSRGNCSQSGALDSYDSNPFDMALIFLDDDPDELETLNKKFCARCPVSQQCEDWAAIDSYSGLAGGKLWGTKGKRGIPVANALKRKRKGSAS